MYQDIYRLHLTLQLILLGTKALDVSDTLAISDACLNCIGKAIGGRKDRCVDFEDKCGIFKLRVEDWKDYNPNFDDFEQCYKSDACSKWVVTEYIYDYAYPCVEELNRVNISCYELGSIYFVHGTEGCITPTALSFARRMRKYCPDESKLQAKFNDIESSHDLSW